MQNSNILGGTAILISSIAAAVVAFRIGLPERTQTPADQGPAAEALVDPSEYAERLDRIEKRLEQLSVGLASQSKADRRALPSDTVVALAVQRWLDRNAEKLGADAGRGATEASGKSESKAGKLTIKEAFARFATEDLTDTEFSELWAQAKDAGIEGQLIEAFQKAAKANPNSAKAQFNLGVAYLGMLQTMSDGPKKGMFAVQADKSFDNTLELDENHWEARFTKAISLSFWPPMFGKQPEAVKQFDILMQKQEKGASQAEHVKTYQLLGNLYRQQGKEDKAREIYRRGLKLFPNDAQLKASAAGK